MWVLVWIFEWYVFMSAIFLKPILENSSISFVALFDVTHNKQHKLLKRCRVPELCRNHYRREPQQPWLKLDDEVQADVGEYSCLSMSCGKIGSVKKENQCKNFNDFYLESEWLNNALLLPVRLGSNCVQIAWIKCFQHVWVFALLAACLLIGVGGWF